MKENSWNYFRIRIKHEGKKNTAGLCPADVYYYKNYQEQLMPIRIITDI
jgi:hypothetical protein